MRRMMPELHRYGFLELGRKCYASRYRKYLGPPGKLPMEYTVMESLVDIKLLKHIKLCGAGYQAAGDVKPHHPG
jgi:hypothetical protein